MKNNEAFNAWTANELKCYKIKSTNCEIIYTLKIHNSNNKRREKRKSKQICCLDSLNIVIMVNVLKLPQIYNLIENIEIMSDLVRLVYVWPYSINSCIETKTTICIK